MSGYPTAAGWYRRPEDGSVAWWDGTAWASPSAAQWQPPGGQRPPEIRRLERIMWGGISWGSGSSAVNVGAAVSCVLLGLPGLVFAFMAGSAVEGQFRAMLAGIALVVAPAFVINAHFCRELERRRLHQATGHKVDAAPTSSGAVGRQDAPAMIEHSQPQAPPSGQSPTLSPPAGWYVDGPWSERWWDGARWTENARAAAGSAPGPAAALMPSRQFPTEVLQLERIRWAGILWGSYRGETVNTVCGVTLVFLGLPLLPLALLSADWVHVLLGVLVALTIFMAAAALFINAHFCRELNRRRTRLPGR